MRLSKRFAGYPRIRADDYRRGKSFLFCIQDFKTDFDAVWILRVFKTFSEFFQVFVFQDITARILGSLCAERNCAKVLIL